LGWLECGGRWVGGRGAGGGWGSGGWAPRPLRHLHYDGEPLFEAPGRAAQRPPRTGDEPRSRPRVLAVGPEIPDTVEEAVGEVAEATATDPAREPLVEPALEPVALAPASAPDAASESDAEAEPQAPLDADPASPDARPAPGHEVPERALSSAFAAIQSDPPAPHERHAARDEPEPE
jgi:hypothetical protein